MTNKVGRPKTGRKAKSRTITLSDEHYKKFKELGGCKWLAKYLQQI